MIESLREFLNELVLTHNVRWKQTDHNGSSIFIVSFKGKLEKLYVDLSYGKFFYEFLPDHLSFSFNRNIAKYCDNIETFKDTILKSI